jgi:hypothetical protein
MVFLTTFFSADCLVGRLSRFVSIFGLLLLKNAAGRGLESSYQSFLVHGLISFHFHLSIYVELCEQRTI